MTQSVHELSHAIFQLSQPNACILDFYYLPVEEILSERATGGNGNQDHPGNHCTDSNLLTYCKSSSDDQSQLSAFKLRLAGPEDIYVKAVELHTPLQSLLPQHTATGHIYKVGEQLSYDLTLNPIGQVYTSQAEIPLNEIGTSGDILDVNPVCNALPVIPPGITCVFKVRSDSTGQVRLNLGKWVTIVDESEKPIVLSEIRAYGYKRNPGPLVQGPGINSKNIARIVKAVQFNSLLPSPCHFHDFYVFLSVRIRPILSVWSERE